MAISLVPGVWVSGPWAVLLAALAVGVGDALLGPPLRVVARTFGVLGALRDVQSVRESAFERGRAAPILHLVDLDAEARGLLPLVAVERADADLHEAGDEPLLHDAREGGGV